MTAKSPSTRRQHGKLKKVRAVATLEDVPNVGPAIAGDFRRLGIKFPANPLGRDPFAMYADLCRITGHRHDPCVLDAFIAAVRFMEGEPKKPWWAYTAERKRKLAARLGTAISRPTEEGSPSILFSGDFHALGINPQLHATNAGALAFFVVDAVHQAVRQFHHARIGTTHVVDPHRPVPRLTFVSGPVERRGGEPMGQEDHAAAMRRKYGQWPLKPKDLTGPHVLPESPETA